MDRIKISGEPIFIGNDEMSRTVDEIFEDWLKENGTEIVTDNVELADIVSEFVSNDEGIYPKIVDMLQHEVESGTFNDDITEAIKDVVTNEFVDRFNRIMEESKDLKETVDELTFNVAMLQAEVEMLKKGSWAGWFRSWFGE